MSNLFVSDLVIVEEAEIGLRQIAFTDSVGLHTWRLSPRGSIHILSTVQPIYMQESDVAQGLKAENWFDRSICCSLSKIE